MSRFIFILALIALFGSGVTSTYAYNTTLQEGFSVDGKTAVFVIDYAFGHETYELLMPLFATRGTEMKRGNVSYQVLDEDGQPGNGTAVGIVLSNARIENGVYVTPKEYLKEFRLLVIYTRAHDETGTSFRAQVTNLPFAFKGARELTLNESELRPYTTKLVPLSSKASIRATQTETE
jgi:hypothetical protein